MRGAPQSGFSRLIFRISLRTSFDTGGRPRWPRNLPVNSILAVPSDDGLRRLRPGEKADEVLTDSYTGIGEVVGVHQTGLLVAA